jgi:recombination protein RecA
VSENHWNPVAGITIPAARDHNGTFSHSAALARSASSGSSREPEGGVMSSSLQRSSRLRRTSALSEDQPKGILPAGSLNGGTGDPESPGEDMATVEISADKQKALSVAITQIERNYGKGSIMRMGVDGARTAVEAIPTGALNLDAAIGIGGIPRGRITEIYGPESSGKTTLCLHVIANAQKTGGVAAFIDAEHALDIEYARKLGVDIENLLVSQPDTGEQALEIAELLIRSNAVDVVVVDSVAALVPRAEIEGEMGDSHVGLQARLMSQALRKLTGAVNRSQTCVIFTNQIREKIGVMFGNPETTTGGRALKFYASLRLDIRRIGAIKEGQELTGNRTRVKIVKNKVAPPFKQAEFDVMYNEGISHTGLLIDLGVENDIVNKSGAWFSYGDTRLGQGRENAKQYLKDNPEIAQEIEARVREVLSIRGPGTTSGASADDVAYDD